MTHSLSHASREGTHAHQQRRLVVECVESLGTETSRSGPDTSFDSHSGQGWWVCGRKARSIENSPTSPASRASTAGRTPRRSPWETPCLLSGSRSLSLSLSLDWHFCRILGREVFLWETLLYQAFLFSCNSSSNSSSHSSIRGVISICQRKLTSIAEIPPLPQKTGRSTKSGSVQAPPRWARGGEAGGARNKVWRGWRGWSNRRFKRSPGLPSRSRVCVLVAKTTARRGFL